MSATEIIAEFEKLPVNEQKEVLISLTEKLVGKQGTDMKPWLGKKLSFEEACEVVFRDNRELFALLAK
ncbi:MAG TPA: hypothetical protein VFB72_02735 [Verrucomicrobiae bacterium]|nr:hypothetical protein [Verrucomicrobiae bacterium]